ncbi:right-handed parallel beta-helix repeat-containing protein [Formosa sp. 4Alg 33]|uniref:right-handed parallel beta-helix repeat-containing protein n=1 Tax=Formosa sp. 4Alg 33 TaxID=3382189 RepID=UPI003D9C57EA
MRSLFPLQKGVILSVLICLISFTLMGQNSNFKIKKVKIEAEVDSIMTSKWNTNFQHVEYPKQWLEHVITVNPGASLQEAIDEAHKTGGVVFLKSGIHVLTETITLKGRVTLVGEGREHTIIQQGPNMETTGFSIEAEPQVTDLIIKDLTLKGSRSGKANGILIRGRNESRHDRVMLQNINVTDWSAQGVHMKRTNNIIMDNCNFQYNGSAGGLYHNVYFLYNKYILQSDCDMSYPIKGKGNKYTSCEFVLAQRCTIKDCLGNGIQADHEEAGYLFFHKYHVSNCGRVALWFPCEDYYDKYTYTENPQYAPQHVILNRCEIINNTWGAMWRMVNNSFVINSTFDNKKIDMGLLKCDVTFDNSTFKQGNKTYTDVTQWPKDVEILW